MEGFDEKDVEDGSQRSVWTYLPDPVILHIFKYLSPENLVRAAGVCTLWRRVAYDEFLWKKLLIRDYGIEPKIDLPPGSSSWVKEYIHLWQHTPVVETECLKGHSHQVLHVNFSHNGKLFATCSKDGYVLVWDSGYPSRIKFYHDMKNFSWKYTQFSQFNESDTLLLVSGVHFGNQSNTGEIAVFSVRDEFELQCRVVNKPYDFFGSWYNDRYLLSGELQWLGHLVSRSTIWLNRASQESESEFTSVMNRMFKFYNRSASSVRSVMVANCLGPVITTGTERPSPSDEAKGSKDYEGSGNPVSHREFRFAARPSGWDEREESLARNFGQASVRLSSNYQSRTDEADAENSESSETDEEDEEDTDISEDGDGNSSADRESDDDLEWLDSREKYLIFTMSTKTYSPHQVGIKRVAPFAFSRRIKVGLSLAERRQIRRERELVEVPVEAVVEPDWVNHESVAHLFDPVDYVIDLHGHIIGMALSPDHKFLYVNVRPWPRGYVIEDPLHPPPIAQEIDIHVIDLLTMKEVGAMHRSHKAFTSNEECFFIFLDVAKELVASGAEDRHGWVWHRYWGVPLVRLPHTDVVNSVAFHPRDPEILVTASDDHTLKVWRSRSKARKLCETGVPREQFAVGTELRALEKKGRRLSVARNLP